MNASAPLGRTPLPTPPDYAAYWAYALDAANDHPLELRTEKVDTPLQTVDVYDITFRGAAGRPVRAWLRLPNAPQRPLTAVVHANGYGAGRLLPTDDLTWSAAGHAHLTLDTHGQGPDGRGGYLLRGIINPSTSYYRDVFIDGARAVAAVRTIDEVDPTRVAVIGNSQGGGIALGIGALVPDLCAVLAQSPFLTDAPLAIRTAASGPWLELRNHLRAHPEDASAIANTLAYVDGVTSARHASAAGWISAGSDDDICPPDTAHAAADAYSAPVKLRVVPGAGHEAGASADRHDALTILRDVFAERTTR